MKPMLSRALATSLALTLIVAPFASNQVASQQPPPPQQPPASAPPPGGKTFSQDEIGSMLAPIALYPDALLSQVLMASTYPLEVVEAARWQKQNSSLKGDALQTALQSQTWDESVKSLTAFPEVLDRMSQDLAWTQRLGDAFLGQQADVMDSIQALRQKAKVAGHLESNQQQTVQTTTEDNKQYIVIEPANPQVVYVPTYQPTVVYGAWPYPAYPPYYPPYWGAPYGGAFVSGFFWGAGIAAGAALWGGWGWGSHNVNINVNRYNNFNRTNISNGNWNHRVDHRGNVPYRNNGAQQRYGNNNRQAAQARDQFRGREGGLGGGGLNDRSGLQNAANRGVGQDANRGAGQGANRGNGQGVNRGTGQGGGGQNRANAGAGSRPSSGGNRDFSNRGGGFDAGRGGNTQAMSNRGNSSLGAARSSGGASRSGGGAAHGGGGGGSRGGGGGRGGGGRR